MASMFTRNLGLCLFAFQAFAQSLYQDVPYSADAAAFPSDASLVFNSIHASMRQFGSSINYENHCAFLATIPGNTQLYHGTSKEETITGLKWLAFEPEHAMLFSHPSEHWSRRDSSAVPSHSNVVSQGFSPPTLLRTGHGPTSEPVGDQLWPVPPNEVPLKSPTPDIWQNFRDHQDWGYLHTYTTTQPLRLLYLDGTSAAKTTLGTLDLQDKIVLQNHFNFSTTLDDDSARAEELCRVAGTDWSDRIDGFIRMETGFEVILCSVESADLRHTGTVATQKLKDAFSTYKALAQRFHDIGGGRVEVDYTAFFTTYGGVLEDQDLVAFRAELDALIMDPPAIERRRINWQAVTDMIVERYAVPLRLLASQTLQSKLDFDTEAQRLLLPFVDHRMRDRDAEIQRCAAYPMPQSYSNCSAANAVARISKTICRELFVAVEEDVGLEQATSRIRHLMSGLGWSAWKNCFPSCKDNEVCYVPVWPFSLTLDKKRAPTCIDEAGFFKVVTDEIILASAHRSGIQL